MKNLWLALLLILSAAPAYAQTVTFTIPAQTITIPAQTVTVALPVVDAGVPPVVDAGVPPVVDASVPDAATDAGTPPAPPLGDKPRPEASKGTGFYVVGSRLYDGNGAEFRMRGTNRLHQDSWVPYLGKMPSNTSRWNLYFSDDADRALRDVQSKDMGGTTVNGKAVPVFGYWEGTCKSDRGVLDSMVNKLVRDAAKFQSVERFSLFNIANEWGDDPVAWRDAYVAVIPRIRAAGYNGALMVDAPGCGQNAQAIVDHGKAILAADPQKNVIFDWHIYGLVYDSVGGVAKQYKEQIDLLPTMTALNATGLAVVVGEFGPGRNIGPSPTMVKPERVVDLAERFGFGWLTWASDDWNGPNETSTEDWFGHIKQGWTYNSDNDLTAWGRTAKALWLKYGAKPASVLK